MLSIKFQVNWPFISEAVKNRFSRSRPWWPSWILDLNDFSYFLSTSHPDASYQVSSQLALPLRRRSRRQIFKMATTVAILDFRLELFELFLIYKSPQCFLPSFKSIGFLFQAKNRKIDFQDSSHGSHLGFPTGTILAVFDLVQVTLMLSTKIHVNWPFSSGEEVKNRFSRWWPWWSSWILDRNDFSYFLSTSHPSSKPIGLFFQKKQKIDFQDSGHSGHFGFWI